jgi:5'-3' exoribonuclease 1
MNGIIHNCTHKDSDSPSFRMTEDDMFIAIFNYIEHLFGKIKPQKLFYMAIDGVAPRAKMNQQRARRFRTALDAELAREKALKEGQELPKEAAFDSNCITPGTEFMARLTQQLKYFISKKVTEDAEWQGVEVVLSGHEVPGEGEHKIMEYIRKAKSQPGYDPNVRHCLYGLDADLIMLGLLSHDPHFCLLREEVTFGRANSKKSKELEHQNFYLMHLCIVREYLELEFQQLKEPGTLHFAFDMERVIDDFILMAFFVGNDFLPNLPHLHINEGALSLMFDTYKTVLPTLEGYINESGKINLPRLGALLDELSKVEFRFFEAENSDASWLRSKHSQDETQTHTDRKKGKLTISSQQQVIFKDVKKWVNQPNDAAASQPLALPETLPARDREFVKSLADSLHLDWSTVENEQGQRHMQLAMPAKLEDDGEEDDEEAQSALFRVLKRYDTAKVVDVSPDQAKDEMERKYQEKFYQWKDKTYRSKLDWGLDDAEALRALTENYVQGLQWVLFYYYRGVASWPWFFKYHYSPMISDVRKGLGADMNFQLGQPFHPYQQLMGVLPDRSKSIVPTAYHELMTDPKSPIIDFYPRDFELDMNGKKQEWEAVVKIPFIDESRLLPAMATKDHLLSNAERQRNEFGVSLKFTYSQDVNYTYPSSFPGVFQDITNCKCVENIFELPTMDGLDVYIGLVPGVKLGEASLAGFPSLKVLPFAGQLAYHGVSVFQQESRNQSMVATLLGAEETTKVELAKTKLGKVVHIGYPFLQEARVNRVSDEMFDYILEEDGQVSQRQHSQFEINNFHKTSQRIENVYSKRLGMIIGAVESLVHIEQLKGLRKTDQGATIKEYGEIVGMETDYAAQTVVDQVISEDQRFLEKAALPVEEEFPKGTRGFFLGEAAYGRPVMIDGYSENKLDIWVGTLAARDERWGRQIKAESERNTPYTPSFAVAKMLSMNPLALSKITSSFSVNSSGLRLNLGLNLKFEAKKLKVLGYSRKGATGWEFSQKAIVLITQYMVNFPEFIAGIQRNPQGDQFEDVDFYPEDIAKQKMKEIGAWLKSVETKSLERVPLDADQMDSDTVKRIEETADQLQNTQGQVRNQKMRTVPRHAILKPADAEHRLGAQRFTIGDRVTYVQDSGKVPLGLSGTIIGMTRTARTMLLDLVMDATFMSGTTLGDRCSSFRGATVPVSSVLNLTDRQVVADTRASAARRAPSAPQHYYVNGGSGGHGQGAYGVPGQQLREAQAPTQLPGTYAGATRGRGGPGYAGQGVQSTLAMRGGAPQQNGHHQNGNGPRGGAQNGYRGRGGPSNGQEGGYGGAPGTNRKGFTIIDNSDPMDGIMKSNPNFRPQSYSNVPPPAVLNQPAGGYRGRGGGPRGRGGFGGRGRGGPGGIPPAGPA